MTVSNSTFSDNEADDGGGIFNFGTVIVSNSIIANSPSGEDCGGINPFTSLGSNLDSDNSCGLSATGDITNTNPLLLPLGNYGGATQTHALGIGSPAIDAGDAAVCAATPVNGVDQRGVGRPQGTVCDIGAFERMTLALTGTLTASTTAQLDWNDALGSYQLWRSASPYSGFSFLSNHSISQADVTVNPSQNYYYEVYGNLDGSSGEVSNRVGVFTFTIVPGN